MDIDLGRLVGKVCIKQSLGENTGKKNNVTWKMQIVPYIYHSRMSGILNFVR